MNNSFDVSFRKATINDVKFVAQIVLEALGYEAFNQASLTQERRKLIEKVAELTRRDDTLHSWLNTWLCEVNHETIGGFIAYDGHEYMERFEVEMPQLTKLLNINLANMGRETSDGEFYIDSIAVVPEWRNKGLGIQLLNEAKRQTCKSHFKCASLLVAPDNGQATRLYEKAGFKQVGEIFTYNEKYIKMIYFV